MLDEHRIAWMASIVSKRGPAHVVVAEDDADMRSMVADALRLDGHDVTELADGGALLVRIGRQYDPETPVDSVDLIVSDVRMPVLSGLEILRGLREARWQTPVVLMTAFGDSATRREARSLDAVLIDKPLQLSELRAEVLRLLAAHDS